MAQIAYVDWDGLVYYDGKVKKYVSDSLEPTLKDGGRIAFDQLPEPSYDSLNYIYTITDDFQTDTNFQIPGRSLSAGTAVKVSEVAPATYRYTIFNEIISDAEANQFAAINTELANLKTNIEDLDSTKAEKEHQHKLADISDYAAPDLSIYAIQADVNEALENKASIEDVVSTDLFSEYKDNVANQFSSIQSDLAAYKNTASDIFVSHEELADELTHIEHHFDEYTNTSDLNSYYDTKDYLTSEIAKSQLSGGEGSIDEEQLEKLLAEYAKKSEIPDTSSFITLEDVENKGYATEAYVDEAVKNVDVDLTGYATQEWVENQKYITEIPSDDTKVDKTVYAADKEKFALKTSVEASLKEKADDILFTEDYRVSSPVGAFTAYESVKDLTLAKIIEKLLGLRLSVRYSLKFFVDGDLYDEHFYEEGQKINPPADPVKDGYTFDGWKAGDFWITDMYTMPATNVEAHATFIEIPDEPEIPANPTMPEIADFIEKTSAPVYSLNTSGVITEHAFDQKVFTQSTENEPPSMDANTAETFFYTVLDENDSVIEAGYQIYTVYQEEEYLTIAIPDYINNFHVEMYDPDNSIWTAPTWTLKKTDSHPIDGYTTYTAADSETMSGISIRIVIDG